MLMKGFFLSHGFGIGALRAANAITVTRNAASDRIGIGQVVSEFRVVQIGLDPSVADMDIGSFQQACAEICIFVGKFGRPDENIPASALIFFTNRAQATATGTMKIS